MLTALLALCDEKEKKPEKEPFPKDWSKEALVPGESLTYSISWKGIYAGKATISIDTELATFRKRSCYVMRSTTHSSDFISNFYEVNDSVTTLLDKETLQPLKFTKNIREGSHRSYQLIYFYPDEKRIAYYKRKGDSYVLRKEFTDIQDKVQDVLSILISIRMANLKEIGDKASVKVCTGKRVADVEFVVKSKKYIKVEAGEFLALHITVGFKAEKGVAEKLGEDEGLFVSDEIGEMWFDALTRRPVLMTASVPLGTVKVELSQFKFPAPKNPRIEEKSPEEKKPEEKKTEGSGETQDKEKKEENKATP